MATLPLVTAAYPIMSEEMRVPTGPIHARLDALEHTMRGLQLVSMQAAIQGMLQPVTAATSQIAAAETAAAGPAAAHTTADYNAAALSALPHVDAPTFSAERSGMNVAMWLEKFEHWADMCRCLSTVESIMLFSPFEMMLSLNGML